MSKIQFPRIAVLAMMSIACSIPALFAAAQETERRKVALAKRFERSGAVRRQVRDGWRARFGFQGRGRRSYSATDRMDVGADASQNERDSFGIAGRDDRRIAFGRDAGGCVDSITITGFGSDGTFGSSATKEFRSNSCFRASRSRLPAR